MSASTDRLRHQKRIKRWCPVVFGLFVMAATILAACSAAPTATPTATPAITPSATARPSATSTVPQPTATTPPTKIPTPEGGVTVVILHTNDVFGQMDPCG